MNLFEIDIDEAFDFYCPITGSQILGPDFFHPSPATVFTFSPEAGDFETIDEPYRSIWNEVEEEHSDDDWGSDLWNHFCQRLREEHPNLLIFGFSTHGIACGPVSNTIYVAIDFAFGDAEHDEDDDDTEKDDGD